MIYPPLELAQQEMDRIRSDLIAHGVTPRAIYLVAPFALGIEVDGIERAFHLHRSYSSLGPHAMQWFKERIELTKELQTK